jgi:hypothetical protein
VSEDIAGAAYLGLEDCVECDGTGKRDKTLCGCVYRAIFRQCWAAFHSKVTGVKQTGGSWGRPGEEFCADFISVVRRSLDADDAKLFKGYFLLGANWQLVARKLGLSKSRFWYGVRRIEKIGGKALAEAEPYPLHPVRGYFECRRPVSNHSSTVRSPLLH